MFQKRPIALAVRAAAIGLAAAHGALPSMALAADDPRGGRRNRRHRFAHSAGERSDLQPGRAIGLRTVSVHRIAPGRRHSPVLAAGVRGSGLRSVDRVRRNRHPATAQPRRHPHPGVDRRQAVADQLQRRRLGPDRPRPELDPGRARRSRRSPDRRRVGHVRFGRRRRRRQLHDEGRLSKASASTSGAAVPITTTTTATSRRT